MTRVGHGNFSTPSEIAKGAVGSLHPKGSDQEHALARAEVRRQAIDADEAALLLDMLGLSGAS